MDIIRYLGNGIYLLHIRNLEGQYSRMQNNITLNHNKGCFFSSSAPLKVIGAEYILSYVLET